MPTFLEQSRLRLGLGQHEMADYLQLTRSTYSMVEKNQRPLPHASYLLLTELASNFPTTDDLISIDQFLSEHTTITQQALAKRTADNQYQLKLLERKLDNYLETLHIYQHQVTTLTTTLEKILQQPPTPERDRKAAWLQEQITDTKTNVLPRLAVDIAFARMRMAGLRGELGM